MSQRQCVRCGADIDEELRVGFCPACAAPIVATTGDSLRVNEALAEAAREQWLATPPPEPIPTSTSRRSASRVGDGTAIWQDHHAKARRARRNALLVVLAGVLVLVLSRIAASIEPDPYEVIVSSPDGAEVESIRCEDGVAVVGDAADDDACADEKPANPGPALAAVLSIGGILLVGAGVVFLVQSGKQVSTV